MRKVCGLLWWSFGLGTFDVGEERGCDQCEREMSLGLQRIYIPVEESCFELTHYCDRSDIVSDAGARSIKIILHEHTTIEYGERGVFVEIILPPLQAQADGKTFSFAMISGN